MSAKWDGLGTQDFEAFGLLTSGVGSGAISSEGRGGSGAYTRDGLDNAPPGFRGGRQV